MNKKNVMRDFIRNIDNMGLMTDFIKNIFDYDDFFDYNYFFRMINADDELIIDIYDNVSVNRFNRYIFSFLERDYDIKVLVENNIFVNYISVPMIGDNDNKLLKLAYLFKINDYEMIEYADSFLNSVFVDILREILK